MMALRKGEGITPILPRLKPRSSSALIIEGSFRDTEAMRYWVSNVLGMLGSEYHDF